MEAIIQFMYLGEASFYADKIHDILSVAKNLQIKQLCDTDIQEESQDKHPYEEETLNFEENTLEIPKQFDMDTTREFQIDQVNENKPTINLKPDIDYGNITKKIKNEHHCPDCNYSSKKLSNVKQHIMSIHEGTKYPCTFCSKVATHPSHLKQHIKNFH